MLRENISNFGNRMLMTKLKIHYDGWIALPASARRRLGVTSGDELTLDFNDGGLTLRPPGEKSAPSADTEPMDKNGSTAPAEAKKPAQARKPAPKAAKAAPSKKTTKTATDSAPKSRGKAVAATLPKARGRKRSTATT